MTAFAVSHTVESVAGYVDHIEKNCADGEWLFRGQPCDKPLLPKIYRPEFWGGEPYDKGKKEIELEMFEEFKRKAVPFLDRVPPDDRRLEWSAIAQHHFMPTRLLDWSASALTALWFSVPEKTPPRIDVLRPGIGSVRVSCSAPPNHSVVWASLPCSSDLVHAEHWEKKLERKEKLDPVYKPSRITETWFFRPTHTDRRIAAQASSFSVHPDRKDGKEGIPTPLEENGRYGEQRPEYQKRVNESKPVGKLLKIEVPQEKWADLREELNRLGVNEARLFPDLDGLCGQLQWWAQQQNKK